MKQLKLFGLLSNIIDLNIVRESIATRADVDQLHQYMEPVMASYYVDMDIISSNCVMDINQFCDTFLEGPDEKVPSNVKAAIVKSIYELHRNASRGVVEYYKLNDLPEDIRSEKLVRSLAVYAINYNLITAKELV